MSDQPTLADIGRELRALHDGLGALREQLAENTATARRIGGDQAYRGKTDVTREHAPRAHDSTNRRYRDRGVVDEAENAKNWTKSKVRAKVEHSIGVIKRVFGFA